MAVLSVLSEYRERVGTIGLIASAIGLILLRFLILVIYRLYFHPLAKIPGSRWSAATWMREAYYGIWKDGKYTQQYIKDHEKYGPIIRLNPEEVHISDPSFYSKVYHTGTKFNRPQLYYGVFNSRSMISVESSSEHRFLRSHFDPFFSRKQILAMMSDTVSTLVDKMVSRITAEYTAPSVVRGDGKPEPLILTECIRALTTDCIFKILLDSPTLEPLLGMEDWGNEFTGGDLAGTAKLAMWDMLVLPRLWLPWIDWKRNWTILGSIPLLVPGKWIRKAKASELGLWYFKLLAEDEVKRIVNTPREEREKRRREKGNSVVGDEVLAEENLKRSGLPLGYFADEMWIMLVAGGETTTGVMNYAIFHTLHNPEIHRKLFEELRTAFPDKDAPMPYLQLEALPYLTAVILESLRLSDAATGRLPRIIPPPGLQYGPYFLPAGTIVGLSGYVQHRDSSIFPEPEVFRPERFLGPEGKRLEKFVVAFGKGSMGCIGKNLAYGMLYVGLAKMFRKFEMEIYDCGPEDVMIDCIYMAGFHSMKQRKPKVFVKEREK